MQQKVIAFFPEAAYGPALNSVGIAQACEALGHKAVFLTDPGMQGVYADFGFEEHMLNMSAPMPAEEMARYWVDFINGHLTNFRKPPLAQIDNYVKECWAAIVDTAKWAQKELPEALERLKPDLVCVDNVILFPAIKQYGAPWVRIISCSENEIGDPDIPPHLSGMSVHDTAGHARFRARFEEVIQPIHEDFNRFLQEHGEQPYPLGTFCEPSPYMNLLLYPDAVRFKRRHPLPAERFHYLQGSVRKDRPYTIPDFPVNRHQPLLYVSFGSLGASDTFLLKRLIAALGKLPYRALVNVGEHLHEYPVLPDNVLIANWLPQPSVIAQVDVVIHHGGNNSFTECLFFGKPAIVMPYVWDGHDNAMRAQETGHGFMLDRYQWTEAQLADTLSACLSDQTLHQRLQRTSTQMQARKGTVEAAKVLDAILRQEALPLHQEGMPLKKQDR
ncbi:nucleotide disphospho-sugar-binding domain-containing protein [Pseudomonas sp. Fl4BN1]|uniref:nucleotide disphospho-sugar-binding domain-containing protein n=1 Tax=Pseudomonas sp. Fl4BN1 TaxID=2697651 RepID=UPI001378EE44|nr:glycosyltransferase [Pseudomonas sp. Fl4BN1]NBF07247.1 glycosyl transferase family 1 [Pseudomonas sp. Fl4BN1]